mgnify:CR=1 FL=1
MSRKKKTTSRRRKINPTLASMFKMTREQLEARKTSGGGIHRTSPRDVPRGEQKRRAVDDQLG